MIVDKANTVTQVPQRFINHPDFILNSPPVSLGQTPCEVHGDSMIRTLGIQARRDLPPMNEAGRPTAAGRLGYRLPSGPYGSAGDWIGCLHLM